EFPVVLLADLTANEAHAERARWVDAERALGAVRLVGCPPPELVEHAEEERARDREEAARVVYVAATRARDLLVVPAVGDGRQDGWLAGLNPVVYPAESRPESRTPRGCPAFGTDTVLVRPADVPRPPASV